MTDLVVHPATGPLCGSVPIPSDKSIGHRALLLGALGNGASVVRGFSRGEDNLATATAFRAMGVRLTETTDRAEMRIEGVGLFGLRASPAAIDCGNSGTTMRLLTGLLAAQPFSSILTGDESLSRRPMMRVVGPLRARGARIDGAPHPTRTGELTAPLGISPLADGLHLGPLEYDSPVSSAQVKSALLLSGLYAHGATCVKEPTISRDHTERLLQSMGAPIRAVASMVQIDPAGWDAHLAPFDLALPGDLSAASFVAVAAQLVEGSRVTVRGVGVNPTRTGVLEIARDMGAGIQIEPLGEQGGEPVATLHSWFAPLTAIGISGELIPRAIDEIPIVCALAARAHGITSIRDAGELRVKESDRIAAMVRVLRAFGVPCEEREDGLDVEGTEGALTAATIDSEGDHRIAMTAAVLGLLGNSSSRIRHVDCIATSFPRFVGTLRALGASIDVEGV
jgi:3-phosphoshikimate 1-carboxyvinyltransferase